MATKREFAGLNVIALVSGGKDSFFSLLHCRANGHHIVALANLHPALPSSQNQNKINPPAATGAEPLGSSSGSSPTPAATVSVAPVARAAAVSVPVLAGTAADGPVRSSISSCGGAPGNEVVPEVDDITNDGEEEDLNSFMYQTVGHEVIHLYAEATGIPLYRRAIAGGATQHGKDYSHYRRVKSTAESGPASSGGCVVRDDVADDEGEGEGEEGEDEDETESMVPLLRAIMNEHPEANAICAGAILSTYQRTRVESVATRLGLTPLAYLWKFPVLPAYASVGSDAQLLDDMAETGLEARIIKVASGGLDEDFLWTNVASAAGKNQITKAMRRFGTAETGAVIGEGGEFETLVVDGPPTLFKKRIVIAEENQKVVKEGGGTSWLSLREAKLEEKKIEECESILGEKVRIPDLLDPKFTTLLESLSGEEASVSVYSQDESTETLPKKTGGAFQPPSKAKLQQWCFSGLSCSSIKEETISIISQIRARLQQSNLSPSAIISSSILLRDMEDFPIINSVYGSLFDAPNPPSRVCVSCGDSLNPGTNIVISLSVLLDTTPLEQRRQGLHVQSRSYWAPANIGPYSQAITVPMKSLGLSSSSSSSEDSGGSGPKLVHIAGQIPLVPATMSLPPSSSGDSEENLRLQTVLSLQHLWRIGTEMGVQWWTSAVAYFPSSSSASMAQRARLAGRAWEEAHSSKFSENEDDDEKEEEEEIGPDLWDRRFNAQYMSFARTKTEEKKARGGEKLPDRSILDKASNQKKGTVPMFFAAEVEELPRSAGVEWHAHLGISGTKEGSVSVDMLTHGSVKVSRTAVRSNSVKFVQTVVAQGLGSGSDSGGLPADVRELGAPVVRYMEPRAPGVAVQQQKEGLVVPCKSLWNAQGQPLASVCMYHAVFEEEENGA